MANAKIVFDVVITIIAKSASGRTGGPYQPRNSDYNGIYRSKKHNVGAKADILSMNFGACYVCDAMAVVQEGDCLW